MCFYILKLSFLLISLTSLTEGQKSKPGECPLISPMEDFDAQKFEGRWYEQRRTPRDREDDLVCVSFIFKPPTAGNDTIQLDRLSLNKESWTRDYVSNTGKIVQPGEIVAMDDFHYIVPFTDYDSVAVIYGCKQDTDSFIDVVWILTRQPYIENLEYAFDAVESSNLYRNDWLILDQRRCSYAFDILQ